jgi:hypothetical protein
VVLVIIGVILLVGAAIAVAFAVRGKRRWQTMLGTETSTAAELTAELATVRELGGGAFSRISEVTGTAAPGPAGELKSELAELPCVWCRYEIRRRYWENSTDSDGRSTRSQRTETVAQLASAQPFRVADATGSVLVQPDGLAIDRAERVVDQFTPDQGTDSISFLGISIGTRSDTIGYERVEWIVRSGTPLYVLGEARDQGGEVVIGKPATGVHVISTRSEAELRRSAQRTQRILMWSALAAVVVGIVLLVAAAVAG